MKTIVKWTAAAAVLAALAGGAWWFFQPKERNSYITEAVVRGDISRTVSATGELTASQLVDVGAQASGQIKKLHVKLGQTVQKGDLIAEIDAVAQINNLNTHKAKLETYQAQLASAQIALNTAQKKFKRQQILAAEDAVSKEDFDNAQDALAAAKAKIVELQSQIRQSKIAIDTAQTDIGYTRIVAPMAGTVVAVPVEEGQTVNANQSAPTIVQIADLSRMLNKMQIAEGDITKVAVGQKVSFTILSEPDAPFQTALDSIDPGLTTMSKGSYSKTTDTAESAVYYYARAYVPNPDGKLSIGMTTQNNVEIGSANNVLLVPSAAVKKQKGKNSVRILLSDGQTETRDITVGMKDDVHTEVKSGVKAGERVIVSEAGEQQGKRGNGAMPPRM